MKKKILSLLAAFFMLFGTSAMAQVDSTLEGDVNGDGVVDIADITAVIAIIKQNAEANPTYYWYAGWTVPTAENIATIVNETYPVSKTDTTTSKAGGYNTTNTGFSSSKFFASITTNRHNIADTSRENSGTNTNYYVVVPNNMGIYSSNSPTTSVLTTFTKHSEFNNHIVYKSNSTSRNIIALMIY